MSHTEIGNLNILNSCARTQSSRVQNNRPFSALSGRDGAECGDKRKPLFIAVVVVAWKEPNKTGE